MRPLIYALVTVLGACNTTTAPKEPSAQERAVMGSWAGQIDAQGVTLVLAMALHGDHRYQITVRAAGHAVEQEIGTWLVTGGRVHFSPETCNRADDVGGSLRPVMCSGPHSIPATAQGDRWDLNFDAGGSVFTFPLRRI